ncbi:MAG: tandem-95 repeat protein, partial [Myxococcales bacterium]|nr:tandem-95 repeat protein [Myxococcales bacterium]
TILGAYVPGASSWTPPTPGNWAVTAVTRAIGAPESYQARATSVSGTIGPANLPPSAADDVIVTTANVAGSVDVAANDADPDGDALAILANTAAANGAVAFVGTIATYTPAGGFIGSDSFSYTIGDGRGGTATATVTIDVANRPPTAGDDALVTPQDTPGSVNVLANDDDPDPDALSVVAFTQGAHGGVAIASGVATYTPQAGFVGLDSFTYTIDDGHGATATATVTVTVTSSVPACAITIAGPATGTFGAPIHLTASATCTPGPAQIQWMRRVNSAYVVVQPFSASPTLDFVADAVGNTTFFAIARTQGATPVQAVSDFVTVKVADNTPQCTALRMVTPSNTQSLAVGVAQTLTAQATCPEGGVPEYQFWVKPVGAANWIVLPGFTTGSGSWAPPSTGAWAIRAVVRSVGSHVNYQMGSMAVTVNVTP